MFERIDTICLSVRDVEKASSWYQEILGFKEVFQGEGYRILQVGDGGTPLTLEEGTTSKGPGIYPIFFSKHIEDTYRKLKERGVQVSELQDDGDNTFFYFYDLDENKLQACFWN